MSTAPRKPAGSPLPGRHARRRERTRTQLVDAARTLFARQGIDNTRINEITEEADVGFGSFYNHFAAKQDLFDAAMDEVLEEHGAMLDELTAGIDDPAEVFTMSIRITARFPRSHPELAQILSRSGARYLTAPDGLAAAADALRASRRDLQARWRAAISAPAGYRQMP